MKYATRLNSFIPKAGDLESALNQIKGAGTIDRVDLNYPEHFGDRTPQQVRELVEAAGMGVNSVAMRFRAAFLAGEFTNRDESVRRDAIELTKQGIDAAEALGAFSVTVWLGFDGYDYTFQKDYHAAVAKSVEAFQELADYRPEMKISIEYKPYEERVFALIPNLGMTLHVLHLIDRPNLGVTLDFCHMLMAGEMPGYGASLLLAEDKLFGVHLNDGNNRFDDGLMIGSIHPFETMELLYYMARYDYQGVIYFDTFPKRENALDETRTNVETVELLMKKVVDHGVDAITTVIQQEDGIKSQSLRNALLMEG